MEKRLMAIIMLTLSGFLLGIAANFVYLALPAIAQFFPQILTILGTSWLLWGLVGAFISTTLCLLYAYFPETNTKKILVSIVVALAILDVIWILLL